MPRAFSYVRFSTPQQRFGDSIRRQVAEAATYCQKHGLTLDEELRDEGLSGYHGRHRSRGSLGRFLERIEAGQIEPGSVLIVEGLDRLTRQRPRIAQQLFLQIINAGIDIVTLIPPPQRFSEKAIDDNIGQLFMVLGMLIGNHAESHRKANHIRSVWKARRTSAKNIVPGWFAKIDSRLVVDEVKAAIVRRIFQMVEVMGVKAAARQLNSERVPPLAANRKCKRGEALWSNPTIGKIIRGRQVLGYQEIGRYEDGKRILTGEFVKAYDAIISEEQWHRSNAAMDNRKGGGVSYGRNVQRYANLFGDLARCGECGNVMKLRGQAVAIKNRRYLECSGAAAGICGHKKYHRADGLERKLHSLFVNVRRQIEADDNQSDRLKAEIGTAEQDVGRLDKRFSTLFRRFGDSDDSVIQRNLEQVRSDLRTAQERLSKLERQLATLGNKSVTDTSEFVRFLIGLQGLEGDNLRECRRRVAAQLPQMIKRITFRADGPEIELQDGYALMHVWTGSGKQVVRLNDLPPMSPFHQKQL